MLYERLWRDRRFRSLSAEGRLAFLELHRLLDGNWGNYCCEGLPALAMALRPEDASRLLGGDAEAGERLAHIRDQLALIISSGLLLAEETRDGLAIGYRDWEDATGKSRRRRGRPDHAMGPVIASHRDWSKIHPNSRERLLEWADRLDLVAIVSAAAHGAASGHEPPQSPGPSPGRGCPESRIESSGAWPPGGARASGFPPGPRGEGSEAGVPHRAAPSGVLEAFAEVGRRLPEGCSQEEAECLTALALEAAFRAERASDPYHGRPGKLFDLKVRDPDQPEVQFLRRAKRLWNPPALSTASGWGAAEMVEPPAAPSVRWHCPNEVPGVALCALGLYAPVGEELEARCPTCGQALVLDARHAAAS